MLDVRESRELQAAILALRQMDRVTARAIFKATRGAIVPEWREALAAAATTNFEMRVLAAGGARADVKNDGVTLKAAQSTRKLSGGASPRDIGHAAEFGGKWHRGQVDVPAQNGRRGFTYERMLNKQLKPRRSKGWVAWPLAARLAPRFAALWVQTLVWVTYEAFEGKTP
ncbi:hypothetical protein [Mycetocola saprophilus]|uniref:hypothetical protein n=1 Tax=Mycetocola saprophilus TaxID=76636 RepID=UPI003BF3409B